MEDETPSLPSDETLRVTLLSSEWKSLKGGVSTINSELAIQLAKHLNVEVYVYLPKCTEEDKKDACSHSVQLIEAEELPGFEPINWLTCLPKGHLPHCLIGHGLHLGRQIPAIKRHHDCKWVQVVHMAPEELGMYKTYEEAIFKGEQKHQAELLKLCDLADQVVAVGPKLADAYSRYLRFSSKDQDVINLTPSIFTEFLNVQQATEERRTFCVLIFGRDDGEDFMLKGYDIAAQAVSELKDSSYQLMFFGAPVGKEVAVTEKLLQHGILTSQLTVRPLKGSREDLAKLFCEVDLVIMPSRTEGFGLTALEALSAGLPVLVSGNSGLGDALKKVPSGFSHVVDSENPKEWAKTISIVRQKGREVRLKEANLLREQYALKYNWKKQCDCLVENMLHLSFGNIQKKLEGEQDQVENANEMHNLEKLHVKETSLKAALKLKIDVDVMKPTEHSTQDRTPVSTVESGASRNVGQHGTSEVPVSSGQNQSSCVNAEARKVPEYIPTKEEVLRLVAFKFMHTAPPECRDEFDNFLTYLEKVGALIQDVGTGSLLITVKCDSLQILEILWEDYLSGHLGEVIQRSFVTEEILTEFNLAQLKLKTIISEEEYMACKAYFEKDLYEGNIQEKLERQQNQVENANENMDNLEKLKETSQEADSSLERLDSSSYDNVSIDLPVNDPTGETLSTRYKREECGSFREDLKRAGHCGNLPDPTYLVGRDDTCKQIITCLTCKKAAEIVAPPGYGKTSVVIEVAHRMIKKGKFVAYVKARGVTCVEDLGSQIIEALGARAVADEDPIKETMRRLRAFKPKSVVLIVENIDNLLHVEDQVCNEEHDPESRSYCAKMRGKYKKDDFLAFLTDLGQCPAIHLVLTSRETVDFSVRFASEPIELEPLSDEDSATLFTEREKSLDDGLVRELVRVCGGIPLVICTVLAILKKENPQKLTRRLSTPRLLLKELNRDFIANEDRIDKCLEVCFNRLSEEKQDVLVKISTFPHGFTEEHFVDVFKPPPGFDLQTCMNRLKHSSLVRFDRSSCHYSLHPFLRDYFSLMPQHTAAKSVFIRHYSDLTSKLWKQFLTRDSKSAIEHYRNEKENIREAMAWCGDDHPELDQTAREYCIRCFNKSAVFLAKMMRKQEFESLFCKLSYRCRYDMHLYSACLTNMGMKIVLSCTCTPHICVRALQRAKSLLSHANNIQSRLTAVDDATRAQCLSKLGFCFVREGHYETGYDLLNQALTLRIKRTKDSVKDRDKVMLAASHNDLAASQMMQRKHMAAIETRRLFVLPDYESILGDHPFVATTLSWIANSYHALGDFDNAIKFTQRALEIRERLLGDHQETARSFYDLGVALSAKEEYESALQILEKAVLLQEEVLDTHDELIHTHQAMSIVLKSLGREEEAEREMELAGECAKRLDSVEVNLEIFQTSEEMGWVVSDSVPISRSQEHVKSMT